MSTSKIRTLRGSSLCVAMVVMTGLLSGCLFPLPPEPVAAKPTVFKPNGKVYLREGSELVANIKGLSGNKLLIETSYGGETALDMKSVTGVTTDKPMNIRVKEGEAVDVGLTTLSFDEKTGQLVQKKPAGDRQIQVTWLNAIWGQGADSPEEAAAKAKAEAERPKWSASLEAGVVGRTGTTERVAANLGIEVKRETPTTRWKTYFDARYSRENGVTAEKEFIGGTALEVDQTKRLFVYGQTEAENDTLEDLRLRWTTTGGVGYFIIREKDHEFKARGGVGYAHERYKSGGTDDKPILELGEEYTKKLTYWLLFTHGVTYKPSLQDSGDFRITMENALEMPLSKKVDWKIKVGAKNDYNSMPGAEADRRLDTFYFFNLVFEL